MDALLRHQNFPKDLLLVDLVDKLGVKYGRNLTLDRMDQGWTLYQPDIGTVVLNYYDQEWQYFPADETKNLSFLADYMAVEFYDICDKHKIYPVPRKDPPVHYPGRERLKIHFVAPFFAMADQLHALEENHKMVLNMLSEFHEMKDRVGILEARFELELAEQQSHKRKKHRIVHYSDDEKDKRERRDDIDFFVGAWNDEDDDKKKKDDF